MYTCQICNYALAISKITSTANENMTTLTDPLDFIKLFINKRKKVDMTTLDTSMELNFDLNVLNAQIQKSGLKQEVADLIVEKYNIIKKNMVPNTFCLKCSKCNEVFVLPSGKLSTLKIKQTNNIHAVTNAAEIVTDPTLYRTKDFVCPNEACNRKVKLIDKEAVIYRPNPEEYVTKYICVNCATVF